jgi:hypothetical protein
VHFSVQPTAASKKNVLFRMLRNAPRTAVDGYAVSIKRIRVNGYVGNLAVGVQMYRQIMNVDAAFGVFELNLDRCLVIGRSLTDGIDVGAIMQHMGGGGHSGAGSAMLKSADPVTVEAWIRVLIGESYQTSLKIKDLMFFPVWSLTPEITMNQANGSAIRQYVNLALSNVTSSYK